jgi:general secretion pathway protein G
MSIHASFRSTANRSQSATRLTLVELIVTVAILTILMSAALPLVRFQVKRQKERELRYDLWEMRDAIDKYKDAADKGAFQTKVESQNYPPDLETLVNGVDVQGKKVKFLRKIPGGSHDGQTEWGLRSMQDDPTPTPTAGRASSTCIPSPRERPWTAPSIRRGREE